MFKNMARQVAILITNSTLVTEILLLAKQAGNKGGGGVLLSTWKEVGCFDCWGSMVAAVSTGEVEVATDTTGKGGCLKAKTYNSK